MNNNNEFNVDRKLLDNMSVMSEDDIFNSLFEVDMLTFVDNNGQIKENTAPAKVDTTKTPDRDSKEAAREKLKETEIVEDTTSHGDSENPVRPIEDRAIITVCRDRMEATITLKKPNSAEEPLTYDDIMAVLDKKKIKKRIYENYIERLAMTPVYDAPIRIAVGEAPVEGSNGSIEFYFSQENGEYKQDENGDIDFQNIEKTSFVNEGEQLARIVPPVPGINGYNVFGDVVQCRNVASVSNPLGFGVEFDDTKTIIIAKISGEAHYKNGRISVNNVLNLKNVDYSTGNVDFNGSVIVSGNIQTGFKVHCTDDLKVLGFVEEAAILEAGGNVDIKGGMNGGNKRVGSISSGGNVTSPFLENVTINADGDLTSDSLINCISTVKGNISASGKHGCIIGGTSQVNGNITAQKIGNDAQVVTRIIVCGKETIVERKIALEEQIVNDLSTKEKLLSIINKVDKLEQDIEKRETAKKRILALIDKIESEIRSARSTINELDKKFRVQSNLGFIKASTILYPNVTIEISNKRFINRKVRYQCVVRKMDDGVHVMSSGKEELEEDNENN